MRRFRGRIEQKSYLVVYVEMPIGIRSGTGLTMVRGSLKPGDTYILERYSLEQVMGRFLGFYLHKGLCEQATGTAAVFYPVSFPSFVVCNPYFYAFYPFIVLGQDITI